MDKKRIAEFEKKINIKFKDSNLITRALIHRSYLNEVKEKDLHHNERLEFLGDAVLELLITEYLFYKYPERPEGELTSFRSAVVRTESLAEAANTIDIGKYIFMSKGEEATGGRIRPYILANTFEALLGAIYLDKGIKEVLKLIKKILIPKINKIVKNRLDIDSKSKLQEISQEVTGFTPQYELIKQSGPDHERTFDMGVKVGKYLFGQGTGRNKQEAEQAAAQKALLAWTSLIKKYFKRF